MKSFLIIYMSDQKPLGNGGMIVEAPNRYKAIKIAETHVYENETGAFFKPLNVKEITYKESETLQKQAI